ncbi:MAG: Gfo/Idh/MocA family protein [Candidatus Cryptobacteroides sp.]
MNKNLRGAAALLLSLAIFGGCCNGSALLKTKVPAMPAGQQTMVGYADDPIDTVRVAIVGLGDRGSWAVKRYTQVPWTRTVAVCDAEADRAEASAKWLVDHGYPAPAVYSGPEAYKELCLRDDIDLVYVCTDWAHHVPVALCAMEHGKHVAVEVPSANSLKECWDLVNTSERTRRHCVILENCCYDFFEMMSLQLAQQGALGEVLHAEGSYHHNLDFYWNQYWEDWRLQFNATHRGDLYPTHGLGPVAQALDINRGDRFTFLVAMDTKSVNGKEILRTWRGVENPEFKNGDLVCTLLRTEKEKTVLIEHDVMTPRPYNRMYQLVGTKGYAAKYPVEQLTLGQDVLDALGVDYSITDAHASLPADVIQQMYAKVQIPILNDELRAKAKEVGGHGGMDWIMDYRLAYCLHYGLPVDMDVYDLASWCCLSELGTISMEHGCRAVEVPDFTRGHWQERPGFSYAFAR